EVSEAKGGWGQPTSRFDRVETFSSAYGTPGWQRGRAQKTENGTSGKGFTDQRQRGYRAGPVTIDGRLVAKSTEGGAAFVLGQRVFHQKFGYGEVTEIDGNKLTVQFDKAGQ